MVGAGRHRARIGCAADLKQTSPNARVSAVARALRHQLSMQPAAAFERAVSKQQTAWISLRHREMANNDSVNGASVQTPCRGYSAAVGGRDPPATVCSNNS